MLQQPGGPLYAFSWYQEGNKKKNGHGVTLGIGSLAPDSEGLTNMLQCGFDEPATPTQDSWVLPVVTAVNDVLSLNEWKV